MEQWEKGFDSVGEKYVCADCVDDYSVRNFIEGHVTTNSCDYCGTKSTKAIAALVDDVIEFMLEGFETEWGDPYDVGNVYDKEDGKWRFGEPCSAYDLMDCPEVHNWNEGLIEDICNALSDRQWSRWGDGYGLSKEDQLIIGWKAFSEQVKHKTRYGFFQTPSNDPYEIDGVPPAKMLEHIDEIITTSNLIKIRPEGTEFIRARIPDPDRRYIIAKELGPPPQEYAKQPNRMSPAGIPMFYGAFDVNTAIAETYDGRQDDPIAAVGVFSTLKEIRVLDLTALPEMPSIFDPAKRSQRSIIMFLEAFIEDISKRIKPDGQQHIEYVPTQVLTEYFRHIYRTPEGNSIQGILYPSARYDGGTSSVLFFTSDNCCDVPPEKEETLPSMQKWLILKNHAHYSITTKSRSNSMYATWDKLTP